MEQRENGHQALEYLRRVTNSLQTTYITMRHFSYGFLRRLCSAIVLILATTWPACAQENTVTWGVVDWAPTFILKNGKTPTKPEDLGNGLIDRVTASLAARMPAYHHVFLQANLQRIFAEIAVGNHICYAGAFKTPEREKIAYFSPSILTSTVALIVREDRIQKLQLQGASTSLKHLIEERTDLSGYIESGRSFSPMIDQVLQSGGKNQRRITVPRTGHLLQLLDAGRMDYTIDYPYVVEYQSRLGQFKNSLLAIGLDDAPAVATAYVACPRTAWGKDVMLHIDAALRDAAHDTTFRHAATDWLPEAFVKLHRAEFESFYDNLEHLPSTDR